MGRVQKVKIFKKALAHASTLPLSKLTITESLEGIIGEGAYRMAEN